MNFDEMSEQSADAMVKTMLASWKKSMDEADRLRAEVRRLRVIEEAAREYFNASRTGTFVDSHDAWRTLEAALAAKEEA